MNPPKIVFKKSEKSLWYRCYYPHRSRDSVSPVCWIFFNLEDNVGRSSVHYLTNHGDVCTTAPATPGLLMTQLHIKIIRKRFLHQENKTIITRRITAFDKTIW